MYFYPKQHLTLVALLVVGLILPFSASARNMSDTHGNDYEYTLNGEAFFPVVWDVRSAWMNYFGYARSYIGYDDVVASRYADQEISGVLNQALNAGVNTALIRGTLGHDAVYGTSHFPSRANMIRDLGMNIMLGGFKDLIDDPSHNATVKSIIEAYVATPSPPGYAPVVGIHGFDEPDNGFDAGDPDEQDVIVAALSSYHSWSNNLGYPLGSFVAKPAEYVPSLVNPNTGTTSSSTIYQICGNLDFPMLDWYPCRTYDGSADITVSQADIWGSTDLIPTPATSNHYYAYNNRDELWSIEYNESSGNSDFIVYEVTAEEDYGDPSFAQAFTTQIGLAWPFDVASSDYRSADVGDRNTAEHNSNAAIVMYHQADQIEQAEVVIHNGTSLTTVNPPNLNESASTILFCVGEDNYNSSDRVSTNTPINSGVIGSADLRILWCGDGLSGMQLQKRVWILGKNSSGTGLTNVISAPLILPGNFMPTGAIWGYFWNDTFPYRQSGFILYNNQGNYVVVYTKDNDNWQASSSIQTGLFDGKVNPGAVVAYRSTDWPATPYSPANDILCAVVDAGQLIDEMYMHWCSGLSSTMQMSENHDEVFLGTHNSLDYTNMSFRHVWNSGDVRFFFGGDGVTSYYTHALLEFPEDWAEQTSPSLYSTTTWGIVNNPMRLRHSRRFFANALLNSLSNPTISVRAGEVSLDNGGTPGTSSYASTDIFFNNLCSYGETDDAAFDLEFEWGVNQTPEGNCLFANVQAFGKTPMSSASFCPPHDRSNWWESDTLLYMTVAPIVHGARGLSFYALDMALGAGPSSSGSMIPLYRAPNQFLNWGPSRNCAENADIVSRVHDVVRMLTGKNGGPDFLSALVNHTDYTLLDDTEAINVMFTGGGSYIPYPNDDFLNFIALEDDQSGDILLLVSHDYDDMVGSCIYFPTRYDLKYGSVECWGGFDPNQSPITVDQLSGLHLEASSEVVATRTSIDSNLSQPRLCVNLDYMPAHSASLLRIPYGSGTDRTVETHIRPILGAERTEEGNISIRLAESAGGCDLQIFNLMGRRMSDMHLPEIVSENCELLLERADYSTGLYFAVVKSGADILHTEKVSFF